MANILVESMPFPKGDNKRYDMSVKGSFMELEHDKANEKEDKEVIQQLTLF